MIRLFDIEDVNKSASAFNPDKLLWTNQQHIMRATPERLAESPASRSSRRSACSTDDRARLVAVAKAQQERAKTLKEMAQNSLFFFRDLTGYDEKAAKKNLTPEGIALLSAARRRFAALEEWRAPALHEAISGVAAEHAVALGKVAQPLRVAVSGGAVSPPIDGTLEILGTRRNAAAPRPGDRLGQPLSAASVDLLARDVRERALDALDRIGLHAEEPRRG